ncbi:MAG TPA: lysylphosphatidylglycerol synthase transmembrane domain-containing protein [Roseiflexaceae bacterium]|nr:lysylphosphatidylglycerol synthase transmembrane domain-containing protein [Roseiflexaceae bacterium]
MRARGWQIAISVALTVGVVILAVLNRHQIVESFALLDESQPGWLVLALGLVLLGYFLSSQIYHRALRSLGYHFSALRLWAMTLVAILLSQSVPAGGVASYAFLVQGFRRRGVADGHAALLASLEALSYAVAMVLLFLFSLFYLVFQQGAGMASSGILLAAGVGVGAISAVLFVLTRDKAQLTRWLLGIQQGIARLLRRKWGTEGVEQLINEVVHAREMIAANPGEMAQLVLIQLGALTSHGTAMLVVLYSLGAPVSLAVVMAAFGIALVSSTFNVLPGGGGTVEAVLVITLQSMGVGSAALTAAVIFRLLNFWLMLPVGAICYRVVMHGRRPQVGEEVSMK